MELQAILAASSPGGPTVTSDGWSIVDADYCPNDSSDVGGDYQMADGASSRIVMIDPEGGAVVEVTVMAYPTAYAEDGGQMGAGDLDGHGGAVRWSAEAMLNWEWWASVADRLAADRAGLAEGKVSDVEYDTEAGGALWAWSEDEARQRAQECALDYAQNAHLYFCPSAFAA